MNDRAMMMKPQSSSSSRAVVRLIGRWCLGAILATFLMWLGSGTFVDSVTTLTYSSELGRYVHTPGIVRRVRTEGWADSRYGTLDVLGTPDPEASRGRCVVVWGDSFVEGSQVDDQFKVANQLKQMLEPQGLAAVGVGVSGRAAVDVYFDLPKYEKLLEPQAHFVVLPEIADVSPDGISFRDAPGLEFRPRPAPHRFMGIRDIVAEARAEFLYTAYLNVKAALPLVGDRSLRFSLGPVPQKTPPQKPVLDASQLAPAWRYLVRRFRDGTRLPVTFVYAPNVPLIDGGKLLREHGEEELVAKFSEICRQERVQFIDMTPRFLALYDRTGQFPCGFHNSQISKGHWNEEGHRLVAEAIAGSCAQLVHRNRRQGRRDVVYTD